MLISIRSRAIAKRDEPENVAVTRIIVYRVVSGKMLSLCRFTLGHMSVSRDRGWHLPITGSGLPIHAALCQNIYHHLNPELEGYFLYWAGVVDLSGSLLVCTNYKKWVIIHDMSSQGRVPFVWLLRDFTRVRIRKCHLLTMSLYTPIQVFKSIGYRGCWLARRTGSLIWLIDSHAPPPSYSFSRSQSDTHTLVDSLLCLHQNGRCVPSRVGWV